MLAENRHGLIVQTDVRAPEYHAERDEALEMLTLLAPTPRRRTLGADRGTLPRRLSPASAPWALLPT